MQSLVVQLPVLDLQQQTQHLLKKKKKKRKKSQPQELLEVTLLVALASLQTWQRLLPVLHQSPEPKALVGVEPRLQDS